MSELVVPDAGARYLLTAIRQGLLASCELRLFQNNYTPVGGSLPSDFVEATFPGYQWRNLRTSWGVAFSNPQNRAQIDCPLQEWTAEGASEGNLIYGYYVTVFSAKILLWAQRAGTPTPMAAPQAKYFLKPSFSLGSLLS